MNKHQTDNPHDIRTPAWSDHLAELAELGLYRTLRRIDSAQGATVTLDGRRLCCFCSNNYLGLANHPYVIDAVKEAVDRWGCLDFL